MPERIVDLCRVQLMASAGADDEETTEELLTIYHKFSVCVSLVWQMVALTPLSR